jgi:FAD/FMN-containing dehydrogenase
MPHLLALAATAAAVQAVASGGCRCTPPQPCWDAVPWDSLNASVNGRLVKSVDELAACLPEYGGSLVDPACHKALGSTDDEFWLSAQPNGYLHTGLFNEWNISNDLSAFSVLAETPQDFSATVKFAADHNLRLVVKGTGHDWYGRSAAAGSLLLWTHLRNNITWHDAFVAQGCGPSTAVPAVTVQSGVQFGDLYPDAWNHGKVVMGGTCDSVGVGGCWTAGCYGVFTKKFGNAALNILEATVVIANGTILTTSKCSHPDLFASIRGGGGGAAAVVVDFVAKAHPAPRWTAAGAFLGSAGTYAECVKLSAQVMKRSAEIVIEGTAGDVCDNNGLDWACGPSGGTPSMRCNAYEGDPAAMQAALQPLVDWAKQQGGTIRGSATAGVNWNKTTSFIANFSDRQAVAAALPPGMIEYHPDREISTALVASMSKLFPARACMVDEACAETLTVALNNVSAILQRGGLTLPTDCFMGAKGQGGLDADLAAEFATTTLNPVLLDSVGTWLIMYNIPSLPQMPASTTLLQTLWPRLQLYANIGRSDPLFVICDDGASGNETAAVVCMDTWHARIPAMQEQLQQVRLALWEALPNTDTEGKPFSGSYWCETDYDDLDFRVSHWGTQYPKLLAIKDQYDPNGLFVCHHCVGSERWTKESNLNCRNASYY